MVSAIVASHSASEIRSNYATGGGTATVTGGYVHITLGDWIGRVRNKRREVRRKNANLRVAAMLSTTLRRAEADLRARQVERANKWAQLNEQIGALPPNVAVRMDDSRTGHCVESPLTTASYVELQSSPSSSAAEQQLLVQHDHQYLALHHHDHHQQQHLRPMFTVEEEHKHQQQADEMWRNELSDLDQFMHSLNQVKTCVVR